MNQPSKDLVENPFAAPVVAAPTGASAQALASREATDVGTSMMIARQFPRDARASMDRILMSCTRSSLAEEALYEYARGGQTITGPSIRLAEELARQWGNITCGVAELSRYGGQSEVMAYAADLETGFRDEKRFMVRHWRDKKGGGQALVEERDIYEHLANMAARRKRACILAVIPIDVQDAAVKQCELTLQAGAGEISADLTKSMIERFGTFGVTKEMIEKRIQRRIDSITPALMVNLKKIYTSLKDGMSGATDWFEIASPQTVTVNQTTGEIDPTPKTATEAAKQKLKAQAAVNEAKAQAQANGNGNGNGNGKPAAPAEPAVIVAIYTPDGAMEALQDARSIEELKNAWTAIKQDWKLTSRGTPPLDVEAVFIQRKETFEEGQL